MNLHSPNHHPSQTQNKQYTNSWLCFDVYILRLAISTQVYFAKTVAYFRFNSWLSFQRLCRLLWGSTISTTVVARTVAVS